MLITAPTSRALTGVLNREFTRESQPERGSAPSRAYEKTSRLPAPWIEEPHEKNAKITISSRKSCSQLGSWARIDGIPPETAAPTPLCFCVASKRPAVRMNEAMPPQIRALRIAFG